MPSSSSCFHSRAMSLLISVILWDLFSSVTRARISLQNKMYASTQMLKGHLVKAKILAMTGTIEKSEGERFLIAILTTPFSFRCCRVFLSSFFELLLPHSLFFALHAGWRRVYCHFLGITLFIFVGLVNVLLHRAKANYLRMQNGMVCWTNWHTFLASASSSFHIRPMILVRSVIFKSLCFSVTLSRTAARKQKNANRWHEHVLFNVMIWK